MEIIEEENVVGAGDVMKVNSEGIKNRTWILAILIGIIIAVISFIGIKFNKRKR